MLNIQQSPLTEMTHDAERSFPDECCGFIFGTETGKDRLITAIQVVVNAKEGDKRRRFVISGRDYLKAERFAVEQGVQLLGVYHSHPNHPAIPSEHDRLAAQPYFSYIILSVTDGRLAHIRSWQLDAASQFTEEALLIHQLN